MNKLIQPGRCFCIAFHHLNADCCLLRIISSQIIEQLAYLFTFLLSQSLVVALPLLCLLLSFICLTQPLISILSLSLVVCSPSLHIILVKDQNSQGCLIDHSHVSDAETGGISEGFWDYMKILLFTASCSRRAETFFFFISFTCFKSGFPLLPIIPCCHLSCNNPQSYLLSCLHSSTGHTPSIQPAVPNLSP